MRKAARDVEFGEFVQGSWARLAGLAELLTGDPHRACDLVQSALERCYPRWASIRERDPYGYVRRAVVNAHNDWWRRLGRRELPSAALPDRTLPGDLAVEHAQHDAVQRALDGLSRRERSVIVLRYYEDLSETQIAAVLGVAAGTVKSTAARALGKLRVSADLADDVADDPAEPEQSDPVEARS